MYKDLEVQILEDVVEAGLLANPFEEFQSHYWVGKPTRNFDPTTRGIDSNLELVVNNAVEGVTKIFTKDLARKIGTDSASELQTIGKTLARLGWKNFHNKKQSYWTAPGHQDKHTKKFIAKTVEENISELPPGLTMEEICSMLGLTFNANVAQTVGQLLKDRGWFVKRFRTNGAWKPRSQRNGVKPRIVYLMPGLKQ